MIKEWIKSWIREIVREEIRESYYTDSRFSNWVKARDEAVASQGEIIELNETAQFLKENEDKTISIGQVIKDEDY